MRIAIVTYAAGVGFLVKSANENAGQLYKPDVQALLERGVQFRVCSASIGFRDIPKDQILDAIALVPSGTVRLFAGKVSKVSFT